MNRRSSGRIVIMLTLIACITSLQCNATTGNYLSSHSLGKQDEMSDALKILCNQIIIPNTTFAAGRTNYTIFNTSVKCIYNDGKQTADIATDQIKITGGKIEFLLNFNFSTSKIGPDQFGYAFGSTFSSIISFAKEMFINFDGLLQWRLSNDTLDPININSTFPIKRTEPKELSNDTLTVLDQMLNSATTGISPDNIKNQIITLINKNYVTVLNRTLTEEKVFINQTIYTFNHPIQGPLNMNFSHFLYTYLLDPTDGFILKYMTVVKGQSTKDCRVDIPQTHEDYDIYGGIQSVHSLDLYLQVANYNLKKQWLDTTLGPQWETNAFQFYAGDLFTVVPKVGSTIPPRTKLSGACSAINDTFFNLKRDGIETLALTVNYSCYIQTADTGRVKLLQFNVETKIIIQMILEYETLTFRIKNATGNPTFKSVEDYIVTDIPQATFKISQSLKSLIGINVFGTGYPAWPRDLPGLQVNKDYVFFYDSSHIPHSIKEAQI